jgi:hypothetical protein
VVVVAAALVILGILQILFREWVAKESVAFQRSFWGFRYGPWAERLSVKMAVVVGVGFICLGVVMALVSTT